MEIWNGRSETYQHDRIVAVIPVPESFGKNLSEVVLRDERVEGLTLYTVPRVSCQHSHLLQALTHSQVLHRGSMSAHLGAEALHKSRQRLLAEHVSSSAAHVALLDIGFEALAKVDGLLGGIIRQDQAQVVHHHKSVIVSLEEPVRVVAMVLQGVMECSDGLPVELITSFSRFKAHSWEVRILLRAHEKHRVAVTTPRCFHVPSLWLQVVRAGHDPAQNTYLFVKFICNMTVFFYGDKNGNNSSVIQLKQTICYISGKLTFTVMTQSIKTAKPWLLLDTSIVKQQKGLKKLLKKLLVTTVTPRKSIQVTLNLHQVSCYICT